MEEHAASGRDGDGRTVRNKDCDLYVAEDGQPEAPAVLPIHGTGACAAWWDPVVPQLAGAGRVTVIGYSTGGGVATALAEQRPGAVAALALINTGPSADAYLDQGLLSGLLLARFPGRLLWRLRTEAVIRRALSSAFTRPVELLAGVGHTPMLEDPQTTGALLLRFAVAVKEGNRVWPR